MTGNIHNITGHAVFRHTGLLCLTAALTLFALSSCDNLSESREGDGLPHYLVQFRYDYNMKYADAFAHEVESVTLYVIDTLGNVVWEKTEEGASLAQEAYAMEVDVEPGRYSLLAWCGSKDNGSFFVPETDKATGLTCTLATKTGEDGGQYVDGEIDRLYYGYLPEREFGAQEGVYLNIVPLVKDTNTVRVTVQQMSGGYIDKDDFTFTITADNGLMDWDNSLLGSETLTYYAFYTAQGQAEFDTSISDDTTTDDSGVAGDDTKDDTGVSGDDTTDDSGVSDGTTDDSGVSDGETAKAGTRGTFSTAMAEFTVGRMVPGRGMRLSVLNRRNGQVLSIPLTDIALMLKGYYNQGLTDPEFLDRQDEYNLVFLLDEGYRWIDSYIYINSWKVVLQDVGL